MNEPIYIRCTCYTAHHFLLINSDPDLPGDLTVEFVSTRNGSIWHRVKWALKHVFGTQDLILADIIIKRDELRRAVEDA